MEVHPQFKYYFDDFQKLKSDNRGLEKNPAWLTNILSFISEFQNENDSIIVNTSGSTGKPKSILVSKKKMANSSLMTGSFFNLKPNDSALLCLPAQYIAGKMMIVRAMVLGLKLYCVEPKTNLGIYREFDFCAMVPLQAISNIEFLSRIKNLIIGGGIISPKGLGQLKSLNHSGIFQTYGMTETLSHIAIKNIKDSYYKTLPEVNISYGLDKTLTINANKVNDQELNTNDIVEIIDAQTFEFIGRLDHVINSGGIKINPESVESALSSQIESDYFIFGLPDDSLGEKVVLFVEGEIPIKHQLLFEHLQPFQRPKDVIQISKFIRTETGKIQRKATVEMYQNLG